MTTLQEPLVITVAEAARLLGVCEKTAKTYAQTGQLPSVKIGRRRFVPVHRFKAMLDGELEGQTKLN